MAVARAVLEKGTMMLLTASKVSASVVLMTVNDEKNLSTYSKCGNLHFYFIYSFLVQRTELSPSCRLSMCSTTEPHPQPPLLGIFEGMKTVTKSNLFIMNANLPSPAPESEPALIQQLSRRQGINTVDRARPYNVVKAGQVRIG